MDNIIIRSMKEEDSSEVLEMMKVFYASPALLSDPSEDVMKRDIADCLGDNPFIECFVFENNTGVIMGYSMIAHSYSTECGLRTYILSRITEERILQVSSLNILTICMEKKL